MMIAIVTLALIGLAISVYGITVERNLQQNAQYKAACDLSDTVSCTRPFLSTYTKLLGISNIWASALYYSVIIVLALLDLKPFIFIVTGAGVAASIIFAYILYFKIRSLCLICTSLYIINIALVVACYFS
jgi:vitamin-K-epoxide reductase (warfarin-sensitive)